MARSPFPRARRAPGAAVRRGAAAAALTFAFAAAAAPAQAAAAPERTTLSPTADPSTSQTVTWRAADDYAPVLEIAPASAPDQVRRVEGERTGTTDGVHYRATADGLEPGTDYRYRVGSADGGAFGDWLAFGTAADGPEPFRFLYFGDVQNDITGGAAPTIEAALADAPDAELAVHAGDLVNSGGSDAEWGEWFDAFGQDATGTVNQVAAPGNHEYSGWSITDHWGLQFPGAGNGPDDDDLEDTVYYTDHQGVRFVVLNSNYRNAPWFDTKDWLEDQQYWLRGVLEDNPNPWTVVTFHHPVFSNSPTRDNGRLRDMWLEVFEEYDVDLVLQGHDHGYGRGNLVANRTGDPDVQTGPVYAVAVTGPKMYGVSEANWTDNGAEARVQREETQTYQVVEVDGARLDYVSKTRGGEVVDRFHITKDADGKRVTDDLP
ncbi:purple acid phosphatase family protein [Nocardiopsis chromatogenes]|uniref:purple acid phosphatase family protein n=1 Tax=Nocardiopsis chromatogenes TaxID=280239 RepID=UPI000344FAF2|nr:metallophosphoesterase family protein [Nocardiopsis chromatogenes]